MFTIVPVFMRDNNGVILRVTPSSSGEAITAYLFKGEVIGFA